MTTIKWEDPPARTGRNQLKDEFVKFQAELRAHPKRWAVLFEDASSGAASYYRKRWPGFEFTGSPITGSSHKGVRYKIYARFVGSGGGITEGAGAPKVGASAPAKTDPTGPSVRCPVCHAGCPVSDAGSAIEKRQALRIHYNESPSCEEIAKRSASVTDHLPIPKATVDTSDGHGALYIECTACEYKTGRQRSRKQAWADFRAHAAAGMTVAVSPPPRFLRIKRRCSDGVRRMRGNPKDDLHRAKQILRDVDGPGEIYFDEGWCCGSHIDPKDARWLLDLVEELLEPASRSA